jgi:hypothetical protein
VSTRTGASIAVGSLLLVCACGAAATPAASSPTPITSITEFMLTTTEYTAAVSAVNAPPAVRVTDGELVGPGSDARLFYASDGSQLAEVRLYALAPTSNADDFYMGLLSSTCPPGGHTAFAPLKIGSARSADEFGCLKNRGTRVAFELALPQGFIIGLALTSPAIGAEVIARAEAAKITRVSGA